MHWESEGVVLANKGLVENKIVVTLFTKHHGLRRGLSPRKAMLDVGNIVYCKWSGRLESQLGYFKIEPKEIISSFLFTDYKKLKILNAVISVLLKVLPENEIKQETYYVFTELLRTLKSADLCYYRKFIEMDLSILQHLGFQLDLSKCAVSAEKENLFYISPKTGRTVTKTVGDPYKDKLLLLPSALYKISNNFTCEEPISRDEFMECISVTGFFIRAFLFFPLNLDLPYYRKAILDNF